MAVLAFSMVGEGEHFAGGARRNVQVFVTIKRVCVFAQVCIIP